MNNANPPLPYADDIETIPADEADDIQQAGNRPRVPSLTAGVRCKLGAFSTLATEFDDGTIGRFGEKAALAPAITTV